MQVFHCNVEDGSPMQDDLSDHSIQYRTKTDTLCVACQAHRI